MFARKNYLLLPSYQLRLVAFLLVLLFAGSLIHGFFLYRITARSIEDGFLSAHNRLRSTWDILKPAVVLTNGLSFLLLSLAFCLAVLLISHRLVGPLYKIEQRIRDLIQGRYDLPEIRLRKGDEGQVLGNTINDLQNDLNRRFRILQGLKKKYTSGQGPTDAEVKTALESALANLSIPDESAGA